MFILAGWDRTLSSVAWSTRVQLIIFFLFQITSGVVWQSLQGSPSVMQHLVSVELSSLLLHSIKTRFVCLP